ncbi:MAG: S8 family serine peptidase [Clostridiales bacterium]|nr:S8 family serine peptidase [Clostridiales bacterium]
MKRIFSLSKRIDPKIKYITTIKGIKTVPLILEIKHGIDNSVKKKLYKLGFKTKYEVSFINHICGSLPLRNLDDLKAMVEINRIYYDDKCKLMGNVVINGDISNYSFRMKSQLLNGRGVSIGYIDTGIHPRTDFSRPRRRILAFKDFLHDKKEAYDDSGHGTAVIAASSIPAQESGIVCAKAFDTTNHGYYSDIIAAMDWIVSLKEKYNIKIVLLNFGASSSFGNHDILSLASETLWKNGLLVIACAGNYGPEKATITSPGHNSKLLTIGSFCMENGKPFIPHWSSRGPGMANADKPDMVMPGYIPSEKFVGTAASASTAAGYAAMLYEKKRDISPDDAKSLFKLCTVSLGEIKQAQGKGYIDINKIEEIE